MNLESRGDTMEFTLKEMSIADLEELKKSIDEEKKNRRKKKRDELKDKLIAIIHEIEDNGMALTIVPSKTIYTIDDDAIYQFDSREVVFYVD